MYSRLIKGFVPITATCKGDYSDPLLKLRIIKFKRTLQSLLKTGGRCVLVDDVTPWNSIRIKLRLSHDASVRLRELAQQRNQLLAELGILSLQFETDSESFTIVDVPSSSGTSGSHDNAGASSSYSIGPNALSFLVGDSQHESTESKHIAGTRRALPLSGSGFPDAEFSSSPKIAKRGSGIRRPRGPRGPRGSRGGGGVSSAGPSLGAIGSLENTSVSPTSIGSLMTVGASGGCEQAVASSTSDSSQLLNELNNESKEPSFSPYHLHDQPPPENLLTSNNEQQPQQHNALPCSSSSDTPSDGQPSIVITAHVSPSFNSKAEPASYHSYPQPFESGVTSNETVLPPLPYSTSQSFGISSQAAVVEDSSNSNGNNNRVINDESDIPACQIPLTPLLASIAARSLSVVNGCSVSGSGGDHLATENVIIEVKESGAISSITSEQEQQQRTLPGHNNNNSSVHEANEVLVNGNGNSSSSSNGDFASSSMEVDKVRIKVEEEQVITRLNDNNNNEEGKEIIGLKVNGNHDDAPPPSSTAATISTNDG